MLYGEALAEFGENSRGSWGLNHVDEGKSSGSLKVTSLMDKSSTRERRSSGGERSGFGSYASEQAILDEWMSCGAEASELDSTPRIVHHWEFGAVSSEESRFHGFSGPLNSKAIELKVRPTRYGSSSIPRSSALGSGRSKSFPAPKLPLGKSANESRNKFRSVHPVPKFPGSSEMSKPQYSSTLGLEGEPGVRVKELKPCNCSKSKCLKLYCECFAAGKTCGPLCKCVSCKNTTEHGDEIDRARKSALDRNPHAFTPKIEMDGGVLVTRSKGVIRGCRCRKSGCLKGYCECYQAKVPCSHFCVCMGCQNKATAPMRPPKPPQSAPSARTIVA